MLFRQIVISATALAFVPVIACTSAPTPPAATTTPAPATPTAASSTATRAAAASGASGASGATGANPATRVTGVVQTVASNKVTLVDGSSFNLALNARVIRQEIAKPSDLAAGQFVAVTAKRQTDNTLLASIVSVFSESLSKTIPGGQRPLPEGNLMTNASIDQVSGNSFTVSFTGGGAKVTLAPDAQIFRQIDGTPADVKPGAKISAGVLDGTAQTVQLQ